MGAGPTETVEQPQRQEPGPRQGATRAPPVGDVEALARAQDTASVGERRSFGVRGEMVEQQRHHDRVGYPCLQWQLAGKVGAISMSGSSIIVAANAVSLKRLRLPADQHLDGATAGAGHGDETRTDSERPGRAGP